MQTNLVTISGGLVPHVKGLGQGWLVVLLLVLVMMLGMGVVVLALLRVLMRRHGQSGVGCKVPSIAQVVVVEAIRGRCVRLVDHAIWMLLLLLLWLWRLLRVLRMKVAQVIVIAVVSRVAAIASVDIIIASVVVVVVILIVAEVDGRDMVLMGMRMVVDLLLLMVIMMRWELLLLRLLLMVEIAVAVIVKMLGHLKMQLMIHATVNRARNWGHVLLRLDFQWTEQR